MEIKDIPLPIRVSLGTLEVPHEAFRELEIGDVLILEQSLQEPLQIFISDKEAFKGFPGALNSLKAIKVETLP